MSQEQNKRDISLLNGLISRTLDSADGYTEAADVAKQAQLRELFITRATERRQIARELQSEVTRLGGEPEKDGSTLAAAHRVFLNLKKLVEDDNKAAIEEVERGEDTIKGKFEDALKEQDIYPSTRAIVDRLYQQIKRGHDQAAALKHAAE